MISTSIVYRFGVLNYLGSMFIRGSALDRQPSTSGIVWCFVAGLQRERIGVGAEAVKTDFAPGFEIGRGVKAAIKTVTAQLGGYQYRIPDSRYFRARSFLGFHANGRRITNMVYRPERTRAMGEISHPR